MNVCLVSLLPLVWAADGVVLLMDSQLPRCHSEDACCSLRRYPRQVPQGSATCPTSVFTWRTQNCLQRTPVANHNAALTVELGEIGCRQVPTTSATKGDPVPIPLAYGKRRSITGCWTSSECKLCVMRATV